jgi:hypothetical protein
MMNATKRQEMITKLVEADFEFIMDGDGAELLDSYLEFGFRGYTAYSDAELVVEMGQRGLTLAKVA